MKTDADEMQVRDPDDLAEPDGGHADLLSRVDALERQMAQRERVFRRLTQMLGVQ